MQATKGAVLSLLRDAYLRRDKVSLVVFSGRAARVIVLQPTSSVDLAEQRLQRLTVGGTTPLTHGLVAGLRIVRTERLRDPSVYPLLVLISDGRGNISLFGEEPLVEAQRVAEQLGADGVHMLVIDSARDHTTRPMPRVGSPQPATALRRLWIQRLPRPRRPRRGRISRPVRSLPGGDPRGRREDASRSHGTMNTMQTGRSVFPFTAIVGQDLMKQALILNAINPAIGGVLIRGEKGTAKSTAVRSLTKLLPGLDVVADCRYGCPPDDADLQCIGMHRARGERRDAAARPSPHARCGTAHQRIRGPRCRRDRHRGGDQARREGVRAGRARRGEPQHPLRR